MKRRMVVAMSGGVDSSVAAALLCEQGFDVIGMTLQLWGKDVCVSSGTKLCCSIRDAMDAKTVAKRLGIPHKVLELQEVFRERVIDYFVDSYAQGLTPNPCIACNDHIKFGALLDTARALGAEAVATGHYAQVAFDEARSRYTLRCATDSTKDQSYVLFGLTQTQLGAARFPIGHLTKPEVRQQAQQLGLATAAKPDSQDVCFVRDHNKNGFLRRQLGGVEAPGPIVDTQGTVRGTHHGLIGYTIGQREGLGLAVGVALYVVAIDVPGNRLIVGRREELLQARCLVNRVNWVSIQPPAGSILARVKIRSRHEAALATLIPDEAGDVLVEFDQAQAAITPGQAAVFYDGPLLLGGGWIAHDGRTDNADSHAVPAVEPAAQG